MTMALYEFRGELAAVDALLEETGGECTPEIESLLNELTGKISEKIERVALYIQSQQAIAGACAMERDRLAARIKATERRVEGLKAYLTRQMIALEVPKVAGTLVTVQLQQNPPKVVGEVDMNTLEEWFLDAASLERRFVRCIPETFALDRKALLDAWKREEPLPDGLAVERSQSMRIR